MTVYDLEAKENDRSIAVVAHVLSIFFGLLEAVIAYIAFKERNQFVRSHVTTLLNFWLTLTIAGIAASFLCLILIGFIILPALAVVAVVFPIIATLKANDGAYYEYPWTIKFVS